MVSVHGGYGREFGYGGISTSGTGVLVRGPDGRQQWVTPQSRPDAGADIQTLEYALNFWRRWGQPEQLFDLYDGLVAKDSTLWAGVAQRVSGLSGRPVTFRPANDSTEAAALAERFASHWRTLPGQELVTHLLRSGHLYGVAAAEIDWQVVGGEIAPVRLWPVRSRQLGVTTVYRPLGLDPGVWLLRVGPDYQDFEPLATGKWIVGSPNESADYPDRALMRPSAYLALFRVQGSANWLQFVDRYGLPMIRVDVHSHDDPIAEAEAAEILSNWGTDKGYITAMGDKIKIEPIDAAMLARSGSSDVQGRFLQYLRDELSKIWTGGTLNQDTGSGSSSYALAQVHDAAFSQLLAGDARYVESTLDRDLIGTWGAANNIDPALLPRTKIQLKIDTPLAAANLAEILSRAGYTLDPAELSEVTGYTVTRKEAS